MGREAVFQVLVSCVWCWEAVGLRGPSDVVLDLGLCQACA